MVIVENEAAFQFRYGAQPIIAGQWSGGLSNATETLTAMWNGAPWFQFAYRDDWHPSTDGRGRSLQLADLAAATVDAVRIGLLAQPQAWRPSMMDGGSPGLIADPLPRRPGDANRDGRFTSSDLVQVFQTGQYEDAVEGNSAWEQGDWNDDGDFTTADLVLAFQSGDYEL